MSYYISPSLVQAAQEISGGLLTVPEDATDGRGGAKRWSERLRIERSFINEGDEGSSVMVRFRVSPASIGSVNIGRSTVGRYNFDMDAAEGSGRHIMTAISLSRLMSLLGACGHKIDKRGFALDDFFGENAKNHLIDLEVNAVVMDKPDRKDPTIRRQEIVNFSTTED